MSDPLHFRFTILPSPEGEALTGSEIEKRLIEELDELDWACPDALWSLSSLYSRTGHLDQARMALQYAAQRGLPATEIEAMRARYPQLAE